MNLFSVSSARYFCSKFSRTSTHTISFKAYVRQQRLRSVREGTTAFDEFRDHLLRDVERCLFLSASQYRRSLDLMMTSSAPWAHVTLYYGAFHAAAAFLGMFGGWMDAPAVFVEVATDLPGTQELTVLRNPQFLKGPTHQTFWREFYNACNSLVSHIDPQLRVAVKPVSNDPYWLTDTRNDINYDSYQALDLSSRFSQTFCEQRFPRCLPGKLNTQYEVTEALIELAFAYARRFSLNTDGLDLLGSGTPRHLRIKQMIFDVAHPGLAAKAKNCPILP